MRALLAFFTTFPVLAPNATLEDAARKAYFLPLVGLLVGLPGAVILLLLSYAVPPAVAATLAFAAVLLAAGLHHTDGVMDVGDALMVRGTPARRREVLKDARTGAGAAGALFVVYAPALAALAALAATSPTGAASALLAAETAARSAMLLLLLYGRPAEASSSAHYFVSSLKRRGRRTVALLLALTLPPLVALPLGPAALLLAIAAPITTALLALNLAKRAFGGISGDASGATGELARAVLLITLSGVVSY